MYGLQRLRARLPERGADGVRRNAERGSNPELRGRGRRVLYAIGRRAHPVRGEALAQPDFALALLREAKKRHIHTTIETCGHYPTDVLDQACRVLDALIFDIKCLDSARHKKATGVGSELILKNIGHVFEHFPDLPVPIRTPVIPGFNDTEEDILGIREMIPRKANIRYEALTYHRMGQPKYGYLGRRYELEGVKADEAFMKRLNIMLKSYEK